MPTSLLHAARSIHLKPLHLHYTWSLRDYEAHRGWRGGPGSAHSGGSAIGLPVEWSLLARQSVVGCLAVDSGDRLGPGCPCCVCPTCCFVAATGQHENGQILLCADCRGGCSLQDAASSFATALATAKRRAAATAGGRCVDRAVPPVPSGRRGGGSHPWPAPRSSTSRTTSSTSRTIRSRA